MGDAVSWIVGVVLVLCRGIFITGSSLVGAAIRVPRITSKNLIRRVQGSGGPLGTRAPRLQLRGFEWGCCSGVVGRSLGRGRVLCDVVRGRTVNRQPTALRPLPTHQPA